MGGWFGETNLEKGYHRKEIALGEKKARNK